MPKKVDGMIMLENGQMPVEYVAELTCPKCKSKLFTRRVLYSVHRAVPSDVEPRLVLAKANESFPPQIVERETLVFCASCKRKISGTDMQKQLFPEMTEVSIVDTVPGNGAGQKEDDRA